MYRPRIINFDKAGEGSRAIQATDVSKKPVASRNP
jgi:hypothetical protein